MASLTTDPISLDSLVARVAAPDRGGIASFLGVVRDHHAGRGVVGLEYSAYEPMAERVMAAIVAEAEATWPVAIAIQHRLGPLAIGDVAVAVVAGGRHRDEAFLACRYAIEELKRRVPIWKRERYGDGSEAWVDPTSATATAPAAERRP
jgi:molybdopterin synthase catalytic subunit